MVPPAGLGEISPFARQEGLAARSPVFTLHALNAGQSHVELQGVELHARTECAAQLFQKPVRAPDARLAVQVAVIVLLVGYAGWTIRVLWGSH